MLMIHCRTMQISTVEQIKDTSIITVHLHAHNNCPVALKIEMKAILLMFYKSTLQI